jgi:hypothetical protein
MLDAEPRASAQAACDAHLLSLPAKYGQLLSAAWHEQANAYFWPLPDDEADDLLEDKYFCIIHATHPEGELLIETDGQRNEWLTLEEFEAKEKKFGSVAETIAMIRSGRTSVAERRYRYKAEDY